MLLALLLLLAAVQHSSGELLLTWSVTRHGTRNQLPKNATLQVTGPSAAGGAVLLLAVPCSRLHLPFGRNPTA